jgi:hypothetical protein
MEPPAPTIAPPASSSPDATFTPPAEFDDYVIVRALGAGRMGHVYLAEDTVLARAVAIKFIAGVPDLGCASPVPARGARHRAHPAPQRGQRVSRRRGRQAAVPGQRADPRSHVLSELPRPRPWAEVLTLGLSSWRAAWRPRTAAG